MAGWSDWTKWSDLRDGRVRPPKDAGVYEARLADGTVLTIGRASDLNSRIRQALVKGKLPHSAGERIRNSEDVDSVEVRWRVTDDPKALEKTLHAEHVARHGDLPRHTKR